MSDLLKLINRAAGELPDGWQIHIIVERGSGWVELYDTLGYEVKEVETADRDIHEQVANCLEYATNGN